MTPTSAAPGFHLSVPCRSKRSATSGYSFAQKVHLADQLDIRWFGLISLSTRVPTVVRPPFSSQRETQSSDLQLFLLHRPWMVWDRKPWILMIMSPFVYVPITSFLPRLRPD